MTKVMKLLIVGVVCLAIGFFAGMEYKAYQVRSAISEAVEDSGLEIEQTEEFSQVVTHAKGEEIALATINFKVNSNAESQTLSNEFGSPSIAAESAKFVVINIEVVNTTNAEFPFYSDGFVLIDKKGREFGPYSDSYSMDGALEFQNLAPGIKKGGSMVFEIAADAESYELAVGKGGTHELHTIKLK